MSYDDIITLLKHADGPLTAQEIADELGQSYEHVRRQFIELHAAGHVTRTKRTTGTVGSNPYEYQLANNRSDE